MECSIVSLGKVRRIFCKGLSKTCFWCDSLRMRHFRGLRGLRENVWGGIKKEKLGRMTTETITTKIKRGHEAGRKLGYRALESAGGL